ncbi:hypothetical protein TNCV_3206521 [Trichonephila clavipes]|nr:hypothetical protein TNCV_3206521 [Trichonephila clavipes]
MRMFDDFQSVLRACQFLDGRSQRKPYTAKNTMISLVHEQGDLDKHMTATAGSDLVQSGSPIFDDFFQHLWPYIGNNTTNVVFQMVKRSWLIRIDQ